MDNQSVRCYCLFVRSGSEQSVADSINIFDDHFSALAPKRTIQEKTGGLWSNRTLALLPGYVFVYSSEPDGGPFTRRVDRMYKALRYDSEMRELVGEDLEYAMWVYRNHGDITPSKIFVEGDSIRVVDGPLLDCKGRIVRIDKHRKRVSVEFEFDGNRRNVSLSVEVISSYENRPIIV
ncbi:MAG: KOW motif-containing protein [Saccharofermentanales bacterium]